MWRTILVACIVSFVAGGLWIGDSLVRVTSVLPSFAESVNTAGFESGEDNLGSPSVDWNYWQTVNSDVVAWVEVPGTSISSPVVRAPSNDPEKYLTCDVFGESSIFGCPYLSSTAVFDWESKSDESGSYTEAELRLKTLGTGILFVFGHNMGWDSSLQFGDFARFLDEGYAREHDRVLLSVPGDSNVAIQLKVVAVDCVEATAPLELCNAEKGESLCEWLSRRVSLAEVQLESAESIGSADYEEVVVFVTCSYSTWANERTLVYAVPTASA